MIDFRIDFAYPWLLLLLIPALAFTLIPYFRLSKRYRRTRNRITSMVLHLLVSLFAICLLTGIQFVYHIPNKENEIILLVDVSDTEEQSAQKRDALIERILSESQYDNYNVGIVTFGFDQQYAVPLTAELKGVYDDYAAAALPDTSATNLAAALNYAKTLFRNPQSGKIVLISDGKETDEDAFSVIRSVVAQGITVDTVYVPSVYAGYDAQLVGVELPDYHVNVQEDCNIKLFIACNGALEANVAMYDNGVLAEKKSLDGLSTDRMVTFTYAFAEEGLHELRFELEILGDDDLVIQNNVYHTYYFLENYNNILILETYKDESKPLMALLGETYTFTQKQITDEDVPKTAEELRVYDQVILNNVAQKSMPIGFEEALETYVSEYGGGLFTAGGDEQSGTNKAYNRLDMRGTLYQQMLPVQAIDYKPSIGVIVIIDSSGSMNDEISEGERMLDWARVGVTACLEPLQEKDYIGIMNSDTSLGTVLPLTQRAKESDILAAIDTIRETGGGTDYSGAIFRAGQMLQAYTGIVEKLHIMLVTDGEVGDDVAEACNENAALNYEQWGITLSVVGVGLPQDDTSDYATKMRTLAETHGHGQFHGLSLEDIKSGQLPTKMKNDLQADDIVAVNYKDFKPFVTNLMSPLLNGVTLGEGVERNRLDVELGGFYGVKARSAAEVVLTGEYEVPIYAQWKYGNGMVGCFMCDLQSSVWSQKFMSAENGSGERFIGNVIKNLMPTQNIRPNEISVKLKEDNYTNQLSVYASLAKGESVTGQIIQMRADGENVVTSMNEAVSQNADKFALDVYITTPLSKTNNYSRCDFIVKKGGVYQIVLTKHKANGETETYSFYKAFSYSEEYDVSVDSQEIDFRAVMEKLASRGDGILVENLEEPWAIFDSFITGEEKVFDPRILLAILSIVLFLLDIVVRKFKFKWPHEMIRDYKNRKDSK